MHQLTYALLVAAAIAGDAAEVAAWEAHLAGVPMTWLVRQ